MKFIECKHCGASLDFGEKCDCSEVKESKLNQLLSLFQQENNGQLILGGCYESYKDKN